MLIFSALLSQGFKGKPAIAELNYQATVQQINNKITPVKTPSWDEAIAPQLVEREKQVAEAKQLKEAEERKAQLAAARPVAVASGVQPSQPVQPVQPAGDCASWMAQAGITDTASAYKLIMRESGCNPHARNPNGGACGIGQQLPCGKWPHAWNDPVGGMIDMQNYVISSYGSWANALAHSYSHNWY